MHNELVPVWRYPTLVQDNIASHLPVTVVNQLGDTFEHIKRRKISDLTHLSRLWRAELELCKQDLPGLRYAVNDTPPPRRAGNWPLVNWLLKYEVSAVVAGAQSTAADLAEVAIADRQLTTAKLLLDRFGAPDTDFLTMAILETGDLEIIKMFAPYWKGAYTPTMWELVGGMGRLDVLAWMWEDRDERYILDAMPRVAGCWASVEAVKFFLDKDPSCRQDKRAIMALKSAALWRREEVVALLLRECHFEDRDLLQAMVLARERGRPEIADRLLALKETNNRM